MPRAQGLKVLLAIVAAGAVPLAGVALVRIVLDVPVSDMTRDVNAIAGIHPLAGILSSMGILLWWASASIYLFSSYLLRNVSGPFGHGFMLHSGLLSVYLGLDDLFQFHEHLAPQYLRLPEWGVYVILAIVTSVYLWHHRHALMRRDALLLMSSLSLLASSVALDAVFGRWLWRLRDWTFFVEDGAKWLGICFWVAFCVVRCASALTMHLRGVEIKAQRSPDGGLG